jgi:hypothetical protein
MSPDPAVWNSAYHAKAIELAHAIREQRYSNFDPDYQEKLLLADAFLALSPRNAHEAGRPMSMFCCHRTTADRG